MLLIPFLAAVVFMFIFTWAALNKPRQYAGTPDERLHFTWHAVQLAMVALFLISGRMTTGCSFHEALQLFGRPVLFWAIILAATVYILLFRFWPKLIPKVPKWFLTNSNQSDHKLSADR